MSEASPVLTPRPESAPSAPAETHEHPFEFHGTAFEYFRIWIVNVLLTIVTLGVYSAWAKVRTQQYLASSTRLAGASFAYLADPWAILRGRAMVVLFFVVYGMSSAVSGYLELALGLAMFLLIPWAVVRSMAFRAHNTAWRNIRFGFRAGYGEAFGAYLGYPFLGMLTLGVLYPDAVCRQRRFLVSHASFGSTGFDFGSRSADFYRAFGLLLLIFAAMVVAITVAVSLAGSQAFLGIGLVSFPFYFLLFGTAASRISNLTYEGARIGKHRLSSRVPAAGLSAVYASNALAMLLSLGLLVPWARIRVLRYRLRHMSVQAAGSLEDFVAHQTADVGGTGAELGESLGLDLGL